MELVVVIALGVVVAAVAIDTLRKRPGPHDTPDPTIISTQKIIVDLTKRR